MSNQDIRQFVDRWFFIQFSFLIALRAQIVLDDFTCNHVLKRVVDVFLILYLEIQSAEVFVILVDVVAVFAHHDWGGLAQENWLDQVLHWGGLHREFQLVEGASHELLRVLLLPYVGWVSSILIRVAEVSRIVVLSFSELKIAEHSHPLVQINIVEFVAIRVFDLLSGLLIISSK